jgi:outer membrane protein
MKFSTTAIVATALFGSCLSAQGQEKWDLRKCVEYAMEHNIGVRQASTQIQLSELQVKQDRLSQLPTASVGNNYGLSFGRRENPTTGVFEDQRFFSIGLNLQSSVTIFNWFSRKYTIESSKLELQATRANVDRQKNDVALLVATQYLAILQSVEQEKVAQVQLSQSKEQLRISRIRVAAGDLAEFNAIELEAQVARDSVTVVTAKGNIQQNLLTLKATIGLDAGAAFAVETPPLDKIPVESLAALEPDRVYDLALQNQPQQQFNDLKIKSAEQQRKAAWASMKPTISAFGGMSTNFIHFRTPIYERVSAGFQPTGLVVNNGPNTLPVLAEGFTTTNKIVRYFTPKSLFSQFSDNLGQNIGIGINVPIFNGGSLRNNYERSKINLKNLELTKEQDRLRLKQDIYQAHNTALMAYQRFMAGKKTVSTAERSYEAAQKRYKVGALGTLELITVQNSLFRERLQDIQNHFEYIFRIKLLEFYKGQGLQL